jgi:hypothetical protein
MTETSQVFIRRRKVTTGDFERKLIANAAAKGYTLVSVNWRKHKAKFRAASGKVVFQTF